MSSWDCPNQYDPYPQPYDHDFQSNFNSSQSQLGVHLPRVQLSTILSTIFTKFILRFWFIYSFSCSTNRRKIWFGKEYGRMPTTSSKFAQFTILPHQTPRTLFLEHPIEEEFELEKCLEFFLWTNAKHVGLIISTKFSRVMLIFFSLTDSN